MSAYPSNRRTAAIGDSFINYIDVGKGHPVLLGHSYLWDAEMWRLQIDALSSHYRIIAPDLWGHGLSGPLPTGTRDIADLGRHYLRLLDHLDIGEATVVGHSVGGMWGAEMAAMAPERVSGLALLNTYLGPEPATAKAQNFAMMSAIEEAGVVIEPILDAILHLFFAPTTFQDYPHLPATFRERLRSWEPTTLLDTILPLGRLIFGRPDRLDILRGLDMPTLVVSGTDDIARPPQEGRTMAELLQSPFTQISAAGHVSPLEAPHAVTDALIGLLRRVERVGADHALIR